MRFFNAIFLLMLISTFAIVNGAPTEQEEDDFGFGQSANGDDAKNAVGADAAAAPEDAVKVAAPISLDDAVRPDATDDSVKAAAPPAPDDAAKADAPGESTKTDGDKINAPGADKAATPGQKTSAAGSAVTTDEASKPEGDMTGKNDGAAGTGAPKAALVTDANSGGQPNDVAAAKADNVDKKPDAVKANDKAGMLNSFFGS